MIFGYVVRIYILYIVTGGIFYSSPCLRDITVGNFWENTLLDSLNRQPFSPPSTVGSGYNLDMCSSGFCPDSEWWRSKSTTLNRRYASCTVSLQVLGQFG